MTLQRKHLHSALFVFLCLLAACTIVLVRSATTHACTPDPGQCCQDTVCNVQQGYANLETSAPSGGPVVFVTTPYTNQNVTLGRMRRLGIPVDAPQQVEHLAYFEPANSVHGGGGAPFAGVTIFGPISGKVGGFRWYAVSALKDPNGLPPNSATALHEYGCYSLTNVAAATISPTWVDQFCVADGDCPNTGDFHTKPATLCIPANGKPGPGFVCYGDSSNVGPGPGVVGVDTPVTQPQLIQTDRYDEFCVFVQ